MNRRTALQTLAVAGSASLAGCTGGDGGGGGGDGGGGGGDGSGGGGTTGDGGTVGSAQKKSDIDGQEVHFVKGSTGDALVEVINRAKQDFEEETGAILKPEYTGIGDSKYKRIISLIQAGDAPEIATLGLTIGIQLRKQGALAPVTGVMERLTEKHGEPVVRYQAEGEDWIVPFTQGVTDFWYRDDLLTDVGLEEGFVPDTWDKLMTYAQAHSENGPDSLREGVFVMSGKAKAVGNFMMGSFHMSNGGQMTEYNNGKYEVAWDSGQGRKKMVETLSYIQNLHQYSVDAGGAGESENEHALSTGLGAATYDAGARVKQHSGHHDNLPYPPKAVTNVGHIPEKKTPNSQAQVGPMLVFSGAQNTEAGKRFVEFLMSNPEYACDFCWADGPVHCQPPFPGLKESDHFRSLLKNELPAYWNTGGRGGEYQNDNGVPAAAERHLQEATSHADAQVFETDPPNPYLGAVWASALLSEMVRAVNIDGQDPATVVDNYAPQVQSILDREQESA